MQKSIRILCSIFGFFLTLALLVPQLGLAWSGHFSSHSAIHDLLCTPANAQETIALIVDDGYEFSDGCGLERLVFDDVFFPDEVLSDMDQAVTAALESRDFHPDSSAAVSRLEANVRANLCKLENITDTSSYDDDIVAFNKQIIGIYEDYINLNVYSFLDEIFPLGSRLISLAWMVGAVIGGLTLVMLWLMTRRLGLYLRELAFSCIASGGLMAGLAAAVLIYDPFGDIAVAPMFLKQALIDYFKNGLTFLLLIGGGLILVGVILFAAAAPLIRKGGKKHTPSAPAAPAPEEELPEWQDD